MTVESTTRRAQYETNGTTGPWTVPFYFLANTDLAVIYTDADGNETTLTLTTHYSVTGAGVSSGGTVTTVSSYASGGYITVLRNVELLQETDYTETDAFPAAAHETALDRLTMIVQQQAEVLDRALVFSPSDTAGSALPAAAARASKLIGFNSLGVLTMNAPVDGTASALALSLAGVSGSSMIGHIGSVTGSVATTVQEKLREFVTPKADFDAAGDGTTDDYAALNAALSSGAKIIDGCGLTYATTAQVTIPAGVEFKNATLQMADSNYLGLAYNSNSKITDVTVLGTSRTNQYPSAQRGIGAASAGRVNVTIRARVEDCNVNFDANGTCDSDIQIIVKNASGQTGVSEGYGALFYQGANRNRILCWAIGNHRHGLYISAGSSNNEAVVFDSGTVTSYGVQINTSKDQPLCAGNLITGSSYGSAGGVAVAQQSTVAADAGGGLQNNTIRGFEVVGLAAASGDYVANLYPAYLISVGGLGAQPASGNGFINCSARGSFASTSLGVMHISGSQNTVVRDTNITAICANTGGAFVLTDATGVNRITGMNIDLLTSDVSVPGAYFNIASGSYFTFDGAQIICPGTTKVFYSGSTALQRLGDGNTYNTQVLVSAVPATGSTTQVVNVPAHLQGSTTCIPIVSSQSVSTNANSQAIVSANTGATVTLTVYNGHAAPQDITVSVSICGVPA